MTLKSNIEDIFFQKLRPLELVCNFKSHIEVDTIL